MHAWKTLLEWFDYRKIVFNFQYNLERLKVQCEEVLASRINTENACETLILADMYNAEQLKTHAMEFIMV